MSSATAMMKAGGARLSFVVRKLEGTVKREVIAYTRGKGLERVTVDQAAGYLVYFPRGYVLRLNERALKHYKLDQEPQIINMQGLNNPNSAIGKLFSAQDEASRKSAFVRLEEQVVALATAKTGKNIMPERVELDDDDQSYAPKSKKRAAA